MMIPVGAVSRARLVACVPVLAWSAEEEMFWARLFRELPAANEETGDAGPVPSGRSPRTMYEGIDAAQP